jgi:hypothetical protein
VDENVTEAISNNISIISFQIQRGQRLGHLPRHAEAVVERSYKPTGSITLSFRNRTGAAAGSYVAHRWIGARAPPEPFPTEIFDHAAEDGAVQSYVLSAKRSVPDPI